MNRTNSLTTLRMTAISGVVLAALLVTAPQAGARGTDDGPLPATTSPATASDDGPLHDLGDDHGAASGMDSPRDIAEAAAGTGTSTSTSTSTDDGRGRHGRHGTHHRGHQGRHGNHGTGTHR